MAVMTTQQPEGALLSGMPLQTTTSLDKEGPNGSLEENGDSLPSLTQEEPEPETTAPNADGKSPLSTERKLGQNQDAFSANQALPIEAKDEAIDMAEGETQVEIAEEADRAKMEGATAPADTDMPDAPANPTPAENMLEPASPKAKVSEPTSPKSKPKSEPEDRIEAQNEMTPHAADLSAPPAEVSPPQSAPGTALPDGKGDVVMADAREQEQAGPSTAVDATESTQETVLSDAHPKTPAGAESRTSAVDAPKGTPPPPATADTSMSETAQHSAKVSRERDIDSEDEPVAKRTKVQHAADQVEVKTTPAQDRMDLDKKAGVSARSVYRENGELKSLTDNSLNDNPITDWQVKQIRSVLAGVKKTKVGMGFRQPVRDLWPNLWHEYSARVSNPVDISTMEKRLRGDKPPYATMGEFKHDLQLMVENSIAFNGEIHDVTQQAKSCRDSILARMAGCRAAEPTKADKKETTKPHTTRHAEPRASGPSTIGVARPSKPPAPSPAHKPVVDSPAFAIPANNNGVPLIRRDSTKPDSRAKRPVKPAHSKDLVYDTKRKKKLPLELRFCDEVITEIRKTKNYEINVAFMQPVDPVALNIPSYHRIIKKPMDLGTMASKLSSGEYTSAKEFEKDFDLIIKNCRTFNGEDHVIYHQALRLQDLYRAEMSRKDEWMAKHAPASVLTSHAAGSHLRDDSDDDDGDSEADPEVDEERKQSQHRLATIQKRLEEEQKKINQMVNSGTAEIAEVEIAQSLVAMLQKQMMQERAKMANLPVKKAAKPKPKPAKRASGGGMLGKKASVGGPAAGAGVAAKKGGIKKAAPRRKIGQAEKEIISGHLGSLDGPPLERAIDLIKKDTDQSENDSGELELDIESLSEDALIRLYEIVVKTFPHLRIEKEKSFAAAPASFDPPASKSHKASSSVSKSKKNKPMSKSEQERRIQQLNELRAQAGRQASGSQEPIESIEGNGNEPGQPGHESEDEVSSEEE
ncbi:hypothetical protein BT67DRAFT_408211, partial [Trichocladium antarcticum]